MFVCVIIFIMCAKLHPLPLCGSACALRLCELLVFGGVSVVLLVAELAFRLQGVHNVVETLFLRIVASVFTVCFP